MFGNNLHFEVFKFLKMSETYEKLKGGMCGEKFQDEQERSRSPKPKKIYTYLVDTGCSLNIVFFEDFKIYSGLRPFSVSPRCQ